MDLFKITSQLYDGLIGFFLLFNESFLKLYFKHNFGSFTTTIIAVHRHFRSPTTSTLVFAVKSINHLRRHCLFELNSNTYLHFDDDGFKPTLSHT